jgi:hypothetical protein
MLNHSKPSRLWLILLTVVLTLLVSTSMAQVINGSISGDVKDASGAYIPKATVTIKAPAIGVTRTTTTNSQGTFSVTNLPTGNYTVSVSAAGFKQFDKTQIILGPGDRLSAGEFVLQVGAADSTITVEANAGQLQLQSESGERAGVVSTKQLNDLGMNGRMVFDYLKVIPGITSTFNGEQSNKGGLWNFQVNGTRKGQTQVAIDGITNVDNGCNCAVQVTINPDAIAEVKILTSNYQAENGRVAGGQMAITTKNGTNEFHGGATWFHRHEGFNAMPWFQKQTNASEAAQGLATQPMQRYRYNYIGYQLGGPLYIPKTGLNKKHDKLYFYFNQQYYRQLLPNGFTQVYVPTLEEINGNFSNSKNGNGAPIVIIDPQTGQPFPGNIIPQDRILKSVQKYMLNVLPRANTSDSVAGMNRYNYMKDKTTTFPRREDIGRVDYQINSANRLFFRIVNNEGTQTLPVGSNPEGTSNFQLGNGMFLSEPGYTISTNLTSTINPTTVNEMNFGWTINKQSIFSIGDTIASSKNDFGIPSFFPVTGDTPIPDFHFDGRTGTWGTSSYLGSLPWNNALTIINLTDNVTKIMGKHTLKAGIFVERARKDQDSRGNYNGEFFFNGTTPISVMPNQTGDPYANALLGAFTSYDQNQTRPRGFFRYTNLEWFIQDNFKVNHRLTLDYGMRFSWVQPQYDALDRAEFFDPAAYDPAKAVRLYATKPDGTGAGYDPATGVTVASSLIGTIVPGSGDPHNGIVSSKDGYPKGGFQSRGMMLEPRFGFAFDLFGDGKTLLRGGAGMTHDRFQGDPIYAQVTDNPLTSNKANFSTPGLIQNIPTMSPSSVMTPISVVAWEKSGKVPTVYSYSLGIQHDLGWGTMVDVSYVGSQSRHLSQKYNLNAIPFGYVFTQAAQDPAKYCGESVNRCQVSSEAGWIPKMYVDAGYQYMGDKAYDINFLRKYAGYADIPYMNWDGDANYNSLQVSVNKRFGKGLSFGVAYTHSKTMTTSNEDGQWTSIVNPKVYNYTLASWDRPHDVAINYSYDLPKVSKHLGGSKALSYILDGYTLSGVTLFISGPPTGVSGNTMWYNNYFISGSYTEWWNFNLASDPSKASSNPYSHMDPASLAFPAIGAPTSKYPQQYLRSGGTNNFDMAISKKLPLGNEKRYLELRAEAFNVFNHPQMYGYNLGTGGTDAWSTVFNYATTPVVQSWMLRPQGQKGNIGTYFGEYNGAGNERKLQLAMKLYF